MPVLQFAPFESEIELPFYSALASLKIDHDRLDVAARHVLGLYGPPINVPPTSSCQMQILGNALTSQAVPTGLTRAEGVIRNVNTIEDFKNIDKNALLHTAAQQIWDAILDGTIYEIPSLLSSFIILSFADLKKYKFTYWFAYPALHSDPVWNQTAPVERFSIPETEALVEKVGSWRYGQDPRKQGFFLLKKVRNILGQGDSEVPTSDMIEDQLSEWDHGSERDQVDELGFRWEASSLREFETGFFQNVEEEDQYIGFVDPSTYPENPGWMLRNLLILIRGRYKLSKVKILCYRDVHSKRHEPRSIVLNLASIQPESAVDESTEASPPALPRVTGWERNSQGKLSAKMTDLSLYMNPRQLADQSVDLNLKLMKWRIAPNLDLDRIKNMKCLLLGAGTLGSHVSLDLMAWGVRKITFVDNANVSFSNPVRQPLFQYDDCLDGGVKKAIKAAASLKNIYPGVDSAGHVLSVPMLGHSILDEAKVKKDFDILQKLIDEHDAIFLLMDTRESRWLPTVMGKAAGKIVMNAALGFDTFVVMRHGVASADGGEAALGCYFCNDVVAPADSIKDQTLDMQCTVTRPGIAPIASALLVELFTSILQHPLGVLAPAPKVSNSQSSNTVSYDRDPPEHPLGLVPHQIRGFMASFQNLIISGQSYDCCSACSAKIVDAYKEDGWAFVKKALTNKEYVTELSGLAAVHRAAEAAAAQFDLDDETDDIEEGDGELI